jgi:hypothetical protein
MRNGVEIEMSVGMRTQSARIKFAGEIQNCPTRKRLIFL